LRCCCCCRASCDVPVDSHRKKYSTARSSAHFIDQLPRFWPQRDGTSLDSSSRTRTARSSRSGSRSTWHTPKLTFAEQRVARRLQLDGSRCARINVSRHFQCDKRLASSTRPVAKRSERSSDRKLKKRSSFCTCFLAKVSRSDQKAKNVRKRSNALQGRVNPRARTAPHRFWLNPKLSQAYNNRGNVKIAKGDLVGAMADYNQAIKLNPKYALAYQNRGNAKRMKGDLDGAVADFNRAVKLGSQPPVNEIALE
jgi:hypothetical protein